MLKTKKDSVRRTGPIRIMAVRAVSNPDKLARLNRELDDERQAGEGHQCGERLQGGEAADATGP
jgi:hypothetical protein